MVHYPAGSFHQKMVPWGGISCFLPSDMSAPVLRKAAAFGLLVPMEYRSKCDKNIPSHYCTGSSLNRNEQVNRQAQHVAGVCIFMSQTVLDIHLLAAASGKTFHLIYPQSFCPVGPHVVYHGNVSSTDQPIYIFYFLICSFFSICVTAFCPHLHFYFLCTFFFTSPAPASPNPGFVLE